MPVCRYALTTTSLRKKVFFATSSPCRKRQTCPLFSTTFPVGRPGILNRRPQSDCGLRFNIPGRPTGNVVENNGQVCLFRHGLEVAKNTFLRRLVVVRAYLQTGIRTDFLGRFCQCDGLRGGVRAGARNHRYTPSCPVHDEPHYLSVLL